MITKLSNAAALKLALPEGKRQMLYDTSWPWEFQAA